MKKFFVTLMILGLVIGFLPTNVYAFDRFIGTLEIEGTSIKVPVQYFNEEDDLDEIQNTADQEDMAVVMDYGGTPVIGDHASQGFDQLYDLEEGKTIAKIIYPDGLASFYRLVELDRDGYNGEISLVDSEGNEASFKYPLDYICIYTCNPEGWESVTLTFWEPYFGYLEKYSNCYFK